MDDQVYYLKYWGLTAIDLHDHKPQEVFQSVERGKFVFLFASRDVTSDCLAVVGLLIQLAL